MQLPITIGLHRSFFLDISIGIGALLASLAILLIPPTAIWQVAMVFVIWVVAGLAWRHLSPKFSLIRLEGDGRLSVAQPGNGEFIPADLLPGATVHPWLTVVRLTIPETGRGSLIIVSDCLHAEDFRRLRIFLRWRADFSGANDAV